MVQNQNLKLFICVHLHTVKVEKVNFKYKGFFDKLSDLLNKYNAISNLGPGHCILQEYITDRAHFLSHNVYLKIRERKNVSYFFFFFLNPY